MLPTENFRHNNTNVGSTTCYFKGKSHKVNDFLIIKLDIITNHQLIKKVNFCYNYSVFLFITEIQLYVWYMWRICGWKGDLICFLFVYHHMYESIVRFLVMLKHTISEMLSRKFFKCPTELKLQTSGLDNTDPWNQLIRYLLLLPLWSDTFVWEDVWFCYNCWL